MPIIATGSGGITCANGMRATAGLKLRGVVSLPLSFVSQPQSKTVDEYALATFSCEVTGGVAPYSYQWKKNGTNVGTNSAALSFAATAADNGASITVVVADSFGAVITSTPAVLGVTSYRFKLDGLTQYQKLSSPLTFVSGDMLIFDVTMPTSYTADKSLCHGVDASAIPPLYVDINNGYISHQAGLTVLVDGVATTSIAFDGAKHTISVSVNSTAQLGVFGCHRGLSTRFFGGSLSNMVAIRSAGNVSIPMNNKPAGSVQPSSVGVGSVEIGNYNAAGWAAI